MAGPEGSLLIGSSLAGRGAWLCAGSLECLQLASRRNAFSRALRTTVAPNAAKDLEAHFQG
ncbi:MAG: YlxR family protein [Actinomycetota bacterium]|nr:YlxR family protein [Actinomycetota bacterium]